MYVAQEETNSLMSWCPHGHQYLSWKSSSVLHVPGCPNARTYMLTSWGVLGEHNACCQGIHRSGTEVCFGVHGQIPIVFLFVGCVLTLYLQPMLTLF